MRWFVRRGLRVLMFHKVSPHESDALTVTVAQFERQLRWLRDEGFQFVTVRKVMAVTDSAAALPDWPVLVTFDDADRETADLALPILRRLQVPALIFVPTAFVGGVNAWDDGTRPLMNVGQLRAAEAGGFELGLHSHRHVNYGELGADEIAADVRANFAAFASLGLDPVPALAFPYGRRPRDYAGRATMRATLEAAGVRLAFRIGNRLNRLPLADRFEIQRLGVRGDESFGAFQRKTRWGRLL